VNRRMLLLWYALAGGVLWWFAHELGLSALARPACLHRTSSWTLHALTIATALGAVSAIWASFALRSDPSPVSVATGRSRFLGDIAILFNLISLALIVLEGLPPLFMGTCR
jgi:hypothetical protein